MNYVPVWAKVDRTPRQYPWLSQDVTCGVCVVGGGITGALCALRLAEAGEDVVMITAGRIGMGATAGMLPCAEYDGGTTLRELSRQCGFETALRMLELGEDALDELERLSGSLDGDCGFSRRDCVLFTDDDNELTQLNQEYIDRKRAGFDCSYISRHAAQDMFAFRISGGILSKNMAAVFDPYMLAQLCVMRAESLGARIFENTRAERIDHNDSPVVTTSTYHKVRAERVVIAAGGSCADQLSGLTSPQTVFVTMSEPARSLDGWPGRCVVRSFSSPHITVAPSPDNRVCAGGLSTAMVDESARFAGIFSAPSFHGRRFSELEAGARYLFPDVNVPPFEIFQAAKLFRSRDGLPVIGESSEHPGCIFAVCCGAGGMLMSVHAARISVSLCSGGNSDVEDEIMMFSPERKRLGG